MVDIIEGYETEEQQVDAIKKWWNDNGTMLIVGAVIGLAGLWGWRYYGESVTASQEKASIEFAQVSEKFNAQGEAHDSSELKQFVAENEGNNYATLGALLLAKEAVDAGDFELAKTQLTELLASNEYAALTPIIALRLARVSAELGEYDDALSTLNTVENEAFLVKVNQTKGDIYLKQGDTDAARSAYQTAVEASEGRVDPVLQLQLNDLAVEKKATAPKLDDAQ
ncbi:YfgM family protein [Psychromonas sp. 14N.309.X.WAT.B.A12]|uniref:YfgM family protein n=1 Tax=unclassified Psychromonas TaxID=2614957 RepID=UPI0025B11A06|nr:tetratricopeptide repeat protein [Psychromonas sp. 14N.309.X.WAT.B.A12]MDN2663640.1 tetratricopeptide repeat protein [Psychromonas sp. 14N.309.X.WAT.B.A12]